ncbi:type ISP restriction/modification enzyme [Acidisphaera rubrifaciens]|uniref:site-specific DNA-methyltransferase (adenine-specific) n=1 Tax=Acidisphaera rubrifaciens HS-AP3 TaxID=1231350 RepID=A0A0D6P8C7_9PROT|nr:type ISP restriction/modification enzyme [Acidisphaera rubrifaciens]GAN77463.1 restriction endonuclease TaqII [Acidisphaera rubrifaciens HS-AP3]
MPEDTTRTLLIEFARSARRDQAANPARAGDGSGPERLLTPRFHGLLEHLLSDRALAPRILAEYERPGVGRPDLAFARPGQPARAFIELKATAAQLDPRRLRGHDRDQFRRFCELPVWAYCNFHTIHLYRYDACEAEAVVLPAVALDPGTDDARAERLIRRHDPAPLLTILDALAMAQPVSPKTAAEIAALLARAARLTRAVVLDACRAGPPAALADVRAVFRETLFAHPARGGYDESDENELFAGAFAQTLVFGLLLAREAAAEAASRKAARGGGDSPAVPPPTDQNAYKHLGDGTYPLLRATLRALTQDEIIDTLGVAFDVLRDSVDCIDTSLLATRGGVDPILYFYEDFLGAFDPEARRRHGVFFTPVPVVRYMVAATDRALRDTLGTDGIADPDVLLLDPACGTGTFLVAALDAGMARVRETQGAAMVAPAATALASRLHGFELLVGPYTVAHYRLLRAVSNSDGAKPRGRLPIYLADTLTPAAGAHHVQSRLGFLDAPMVDERQAADTLKRETEIIAIIGNPPYRRLGEGEEAGIVGGWTNGFWDDLKDPVRRAGWGGELNTFPDLYIAFWRWCIWKLFESDGASGRGVLCLITNRTFLAGHPYAGLRRMLRQRFERIDIIDLRGDSRGARPAGIAEDENVFAIQAGVCILLAIAPQTARPAETEARIRYADVWRVGAFTARAKCQFLETAISCPDKIDFVEVDRSDLDDFAPIPFAGLDWPDISAGFAFKHSGVQTKRDEFAYGFNSSGLLARWALVSSLAAEERKEAFHETAARSASTAFATDLMEQEIVAASYRPLDRRFLIYADRAVDRPRPALRNAWGSKNLALFVLPSGTGAGPAVWVHGLLPDYHAFRGSYGGYAFPLWDRRHGDAASNVVPALLAGLAAAYGHAVTPQEAFDAIAALLSATSYTQRFAWDLEETFARVPFPADAATFADAARIGAEIRALETFARKPAADFHSARLDGRASGVTLGAAGTFQQDGRGSGTVALQDDQSLRLTALPQRVWEFAVSGYRVLPRWLAARRGEALDAALMRGILDVAWRIEELLHWFDAADTVLARALVAPLTCETLGLPGSGESDAPPVTSPNANPPSPA